jgi:hypothetical protein
MLGGRPIAASGELTLAGLDLRPLTPSDECECERRDEDDRDNDDNDHSNSRHLSASPVRSWFRARPTGADRSLGKGYPGSAHT